LLTRMDTPLGDTVGNAIETREALDVLHGRGPADLVACTMALGAEMLVLGGKAADVGEARTKLDHALAGGAARKVMERMVAAQGGDPSVVDDPSRLDVAKHSVPVAATRDGWVARADALEIGLAAVAMGAGRTRADQAVDPAVGITIHKKPGARVSRGEPLATLHVRAPKDTAPSERVAAAFEIAEEAPAPAELVLGRA
jgi:thymidine phosphorylase